MERDERPEMRDTMTNHAAAYLTECSHIAIDLFYECLDAGHRTKASNRQAFNELAADRIAAHDWVINCPHGVDVALVTYVIEREVRAAYYANINKWLSWQRSEP
jgi:hypothetical protein